VFPFDHAKLAGYRALVMVRLGRIEEAEMAFAESFSSAQPVGKPRGVLMTEMATIKAMAGHSEEAFKLADSALTIGLTYGSERVVHRVRRFRRQYTGPMTTTVREFDERLQATLL
jgi:hypothetical protein